MKKNMKIWNSHFNGFGINSKNKKKSINKNKRPNSSIKLNTRNTNKNFVNINSNNKNSIIKPKNKFRPNSAGGFKIKNNNNNNLLNSLFSLQPLNNFHNIKNNSLPKIGKGQVKNKNKKESEMERINKIMNSKISNIKSWNNHKEKFTENKITNNFIDNHNFLKKVENFRRKKSVNNNLFNGNKNKNINLNSKNPVNNNIIINNIVIANHNNIEPLKDKKVTNNNIKPKIFFNKDNNNGKIELKIDENWGKIDSNCANGLVNIGATCYMNATLQCLAHVRQLTKHLLKHQKMNIYIDKYKLTNAYTEVLKNIWQNKSIKYYSPNKFKDLISQMNPLFAGIQANDSKDLILFLMETLHNELNKPNEGNINFANVNQYDYESTFNSFKIYFTNNYKSKISHLFYGMTNSTMTCAHCNITTNNIQCFNILIFPLEEVRKFKNRIQNNVNIDECFEYNQKIENMYGENQIYCNKCHNMSDSFNKTQIIISPNILVINLNRGKGLQYEIKLNFEEYLDIEKFVYYKESPSFYEIIGIVTHFGPSSMSGHFIAFCKSFVDENWYKYNDAQVDISSFEEAKSTGIPYILFYSYIQR